MISDDKRLCKDIAKAALVLATAIFLCRATNGYFAIAMAVLGVWWACTQKFGLALSCFAFFPFMLILDHALLPKTTVLGIVLRISPLVIGLILFIMSTSRRGVNRLPFGSLFFYLFLAIISSTGGWAPMISYLKLINFILFLIGIWLGTQNLQDRMNDIYRERVFFLALATVLIFGSILVIPFPSISYSTSLGLEERQSDVAAMVALANLRETGGVTLFSGITNQSQALAPILSCCIAFVLSDMLFIMRRKSILHLALIIFGVIELSMTRSRTGLFSFFVGAYMVLIYAAKNLQLSINMRTRIQKMATTGVILLLLSAVTSEIVNGTITKWLYKGSYEPPNIKRIGMGEALTGTRQALIEMCLDEFRRNPLWGSGFQVNFETAELFGGKGIVFSAPVEKGLLPLMVLGEGGIIGAIAFSVFLIAFYFECTKKRLQITIAMFTTFLATNFGEATFFSPGGSGGILWMVCVVGGFMLDTLQVSIQRQIDRNTLVCQWP